MEQNMTRSGTVVPFPLWARTADVRRSTDLLMKKNGAAADRYWQQVVNRSVMDLQTIGLSHDVIDREILAFSEAVFREIRERFTDAEGGAA